MIYWDHNATSPLRRSVKERIKEALEIYQGNPNSSHSLGQTSRAAIEKARRSLAEKFGAQPSEIVFTASATESNVIALWGLWLERTQSHPERKKILVSPIEHSSIHENVLFLKERFGAEVVWIPLDSKGLFDLEKIEQILRKDSRQFVLCSAIGAHNEMGILQPWLQLAELCKEHSLPYHTDLVQCVGRLPLHLNKSGVSAATLCFHKVGGPKGVGALYVRDKVKLESILRGGSQEKKRRAGTENILAIVGAGALIEDCSDLEKIFDGSVRLIRDQFESELKKKLPFVSIVSETAPRIPNTSYIVFKQAKADALLMSLDFKGICLSSGSACSSGVVLPSRALLQLGYSEAEAITAVRFSLGPDNTLDEVPQVVEAVTNSIEKMAA